ncbi:reverse transcriptase [Senna tora]|uniref:Reverse transcriptase n=1 Tax=Senna tora TaxID=362788 RepID=A0A834T0X1_9FABA|nr:reverse transcriptase [Senna tora]
MQHLHNQKESNQRQQEHLRQEINFRERFSLTPKMPLVIPIREAYPKAPPVPTQELLKLMENPNTQICYPWRAWDNLMTGLMAQAPWTHDWAFLKSKNMFNRMENQEICNVMLGFRSNSLVLVFPPAQVQSQVQPEPEMNSLMLDISPSPMLSTLNLNSCPVKVMLNGKLPEGARIVGAEVAVIDVFVNAFMKLGTGTLDYQISATSLMTKREFAKAVNPSDSSDSDSSGSVGQNFPYCDTFMDFNILCWNARGAASAEFRQVFMDLKNRYSPNVVFIYETRVGSNGAKSILNNLGYSGYFKVDLLGYAGGLWVLWNSREINLTVQGSTFQEIHATLEVRDQPLMLISFIYANPLLERRRFVWKNLEDIAVVNSLPWVVCGDFNEMLSRDEKWGGNPASLNRIREFSNCLANSGLEDLGFVGQKYSWFNKRDNGHMILERIDRFLANASWIQHFPHVVNHHLPRVKSDHTPILLFSRDVNVDFSKRPFRCERAWLKEPDFLKLAENAWHEAPNSYKGLPLIRDRAIDWNKNSFGNIFQRKNKIFRRMEGINKAMNYGPKPHLIKIEQALAQEYQKVLDQEEELWASKARLDWLQLGDSNTAYFHSSVVSCRRKNKILALKDARGNWIYEANVIREHIIGYFQDCFQNIPTSEFLALIHPPKIDSTHHSHLESVPTPKEVKEALWDLKPFNAAGIDGFQPGFFQNCWSFLEKDLVYEIQNAFLRNSIPEDRNKTMICFVPKCPNPLEIKNFPPISLCYTLYKVVSKILVNRLKPLIPDLLNFNQGPFVPGRKTIDNVIIAQELVHSMKKKRKGKHGWILVENCISSVQQCILVNGGLSRFFKPSRGLTINNSKTSIWFAPSTPAEEKSLVMRNFSFKIETKPGIYLGHSLGIGNKTSDFKSIIDKLVGKMEMWNSKFLSKASRVTLLNSVCCPLLAYYMQSLKLPVVVCNSIEKIQRNFFWKSGNKQSIHTINWETICKPKWLGGFGIGRIKDRNHALLAKLSWRVTNENQQVWAKLMKVYNQESRANGSVVGKGIKWGLKLLEIGLHSVIYSGEDTLVWKDTWAGNTPIRQLISGPLNLHEDTLSVKNFADDLGKWKWDKISFELPLHIKERIMGIPCFKDSVLKDRKAWS